jgi:formylglycine-generating enzyme required for sulfatase activity
MPDVSRANWSASELKAPTRVGRYPPNGYGLYDMAGNVWEYVQDEWQENYEPIERSGNRDLIPLSAALNATTRRVIRGGSWGGSAINLRVRYRDSHPPAGAGDHVGFRCARSATSAPSRP